VEPILALVDILIPTYRRKTGLAVVLTSLLGQTFTDFDVIVSDQTEENRTYLDSIEIQTLVQALKWHGHNVVLHRHLPRHGMAEQRQFLLEQSRAPYVHYLDDDVLLDPSVMMRMLDVLRKVVVSSVALQQGLATSMMCDLTSSKLNSGRNECSRNLSNRIQFPGIGIK